MDQVVNLLAPGNPDVIGQAVITGLPDDRFPDDLKRLAPVIVVDGRTFLIVPNFTYGEQPLATYVEVTPQVVSGAFAPVSAVGEGIWPGYATSSTGSTSGEKE